MTDALKPCPHCGWPAQLCDEHGYWSVECTNPDCGPCQGAPDECVKWWNRRAE